MLRYPRRLSLHWVYTNEPPRRGFRTATIPVMLWQGTQFGAPRRGHSGPAQDHDLEITPDGCSFELEPENGCSANLDRHKPAVAKVIVVPSDNETVAPAGWFGLVAPPASPPVMVGPSGLANRLPGTPDSGRANSAARSITGGPGHDVIVEPATRRGPESMNSTAVMG